MQRIAAAFAKAIPVTRKEKGCVAYDLNHDTEKETRYVIYERWKSIADLQAHLKSAHITALCSSPRERPPRSRARLTDRTVGGIDQKWFRVSPRARG